MKKTTALIGIALMASLAVALAACGAENSSDNGNGQNNSPDNPSNSKPRTPLVYDTEFEDLTSEKVDEDGWKLAFNNLKANRSVCVDDTDRESQTSKKAFFFSDGTTLNIQYGMSEAYYNKAEDGTLTIVDKNPDQTVYKSIFAPGDKDYEKYLVNYEGNFGMCVPDFSEHFGKFTYDETQKSYVQEAPFTSNPLMEKGKEVAYSNATVKIIDGDLAYITCTIRGDYDYVIRFYEYDITETAEPTGTPASGDEDEEESGTVNESSIVGTYYSVEKSPEGWKVNQNDATAITLESGGVCTVGGEQGTYELVDHETAVMIVLQTESGNFQASIGKKKDLWLFGTGDIQVFYAGESIDPELYAAIVGSLGDGVLDQNQQSPEEND